jgi:hypothetical protein
MFARVLSLLAACTLALAQPLAGYCACVGCSAEEEAGLHAAGPAGSCCAAKAAAASCCESPDGCSCGHGGHSVATSCSPHADDAGIPSCSCSVTPPPAAAASGAQRVDHAASAHALTAASALVFDVAPQLSLGQFSPADLPPPGGGLRVHALYRVWQI